MDEEFYRSYPPPKSSKRTSTLDDLQDIRNIQSNKICLPQKLQKLGINQFLIVRTFGEASTKHESTIIDDLEQEDWNKKKSDVINLFKDKNQIDPDYKYEQSFNKVYEKEERDS